MRANQSIILAGVAAVTLSVATMSATAAFAKDPIPPGDGEFTKYGDVEDWTVWVDSERSTCLIEKTFESGAVVQMGLTKNHKHGYLGVFTPADEDVRNRQRVEVAIDGQIFDDRARGIKAKKLKGNYRGGYILTDDPAFASAVAEGQTMVVFPSKNAAFQVDLTGTKKAMELGRKCNREQGA